ncbi:MAG: hypothetical protein LBQ36_05820, partial [Synergistaceae bacterium]|nr:hypothetical protein [Synergistaceae bacterium]
PIADSLIKKYAELRHIDVETIMFVVNHKYAGSKDKIVLARTARVPDKWRDILYQLGACSFLYIMEFYAKTTDCLDENQMTALVYRELRRIGPEGKMTSPDTNEWWQVLIGLGRHWFYPDMSCPNLLDDKIDWKTLMGSDYEPPAN